MFRILYFTCAGFTALHWASIGGVKGSVKYLMKKSADMNKIDKQVRLTAVNNTNVD